MSLTVPARSIPTGSTGVRSLPLPVAFGAKVSPAYTTPAQGLATNSTRRLTATAATLALVATVLVGAPRASGSCDGAEATIAATQRALSQGQASVALSALASLAESHPECVPAIMLRAQVAAARGDASQAESLFQQATDLAPTRPEPFFELGVFYDGRQQHGRAAEQFRKVLEIAPNDPQAWDYLGLSLEALGDFDRADSAYRMGLARNQGPRFDPMLHYNYGRLLMKLGRLAEAEEHLDRAVRLAPSMRAVHYERARLAERTGDAARALGHAERALRTADARGVILDMQVHYLLSRLHRALGNTEKAKEYQTLTEGAEVPLDARRRSAR
ncbi:MAG: tetratricopeptide repeat protein [Bryobacterales bacterium]|nr:tetratricopeptide repeat protein [Bryobacterales bacterium]